MFKLSKFVVLGAFMAAGVGFNLPANAETFNFDSPLTLSPTAVDGAWYTDRYAPAGFASGSVPGGGTGLNLILSTADSATNRPGSFSNSFYDTQGRAFNTPNAYAMSIDMYIDTAWGSSDRIGGIWGVGVNSSSAVVSYPILEFANGAFQAWDESIPFGGDWVGINIGTITTGWYNLAFVLDSVNDLIRYSINGNEVAAVSAIGTTQFSSVILQGINKPNPDGVNRTLYFDNLEVAQTPLPGALPLFASGLGALGLMVARRRKRNAQAAIAA